MTTTQHYGTQALAEFAAKYGARAKPSGYVLIDAGGVTHIVEWRARGAGFQFGARSVAEESVHHWRWRDTPEQAARVVGWQPVGEQHTPSPLAPDPLTETYRDGCRDLLAQLEAMQAERDAAWRERDDALARLDDANRRLRAIKAVIAAAMGEKP